MCADAINSPAKNASIVMEAAWRQSCQRTWIGSKTGAALGPRRFIRGFATRSRRERNKRQNDGLHDVTLDSQPQGSLAPPAALP
jgi:hypothetical protein